MGARPHHPREDPHDPLIANLGTTELLIILAVLVLLFGATKLPELARGSGRALRIFKAETKGLMDEDDDEDEGTKTPEQRELETRQADLAQRAGRARRRGRPPAPRRHRLTLSTLDPVAWPSPLARLARPPCRRRTAGWPSPTTSASCGPD